MWCIGPKPGLCDVLARTHLTSPVLMVTSGVADFVDGQEYHILMEVGMGFNPLLLNIPGLIAFPISKL